MSSPVPWVPAFWKLSYQTKQFQAGIPGGADVNAGQHTVLDALAFPPAAGIVAEQQTVAVEAAEEQAHPQAGISGPNDPTPLY